MWQYVNSRSPQTLKTGILHLGKVVLGDSGGAHTSHLLYTFALQITQAIRY